jgi:hypothetical protein
MTKFQTGRPALEFSCANPGHIWARPFPLSLSRKGKPLKAAKNNPRVLQSYVTYDTLLWTRILQDNTFDDFEPVLGSSQDFEPKTSGQGLRKAFQ